MCCGKPRAIATVESWRFEFSSAWEPVDNYELERAQPASTATAIEQMVLDEEESEDDSPLLEHFRCKRPSGSGSVRRAFFAYLQKSRVLGVL